MSLNALKQLRAAISHLNPEQVRREADRQLTIGLVASTSAGYADMEDFLLPRAVSHDDRVELMQRIHRSGDPGAPGKYDLVLYEQGLPCPANAFTFYRQHPYRTICEIVEHREELRLPLARTFHPFRKPVVERTIHEVAKENALFALATALPNIVPNLIELPWAVGEFASDTVFLTVNQIRMAFLIAAAHDKPVGYSEQKVEIGSIVAGAFGWRTIARELVGKVPLGGGLIPKGAIAFAGTYVVGLGLDRLNRFGHDFSRAERRAAYDAAFERGKGVAGGLLENLKKRPA